MDNLFVLRLKSEIKPYQLCTLIYKRHHKGLKSALHAAFTTLFADERQEKTPSEEGGRRGIPQN